MANRLRVLPYKQGSRSAKALAVSLGGLCLKLQGSKFNPRAGDTIINWGNSSLAEEATLNNNRENLEQATNKLHFFNKMRDTGLTPRFWTSQQDIPDEAFPIVCRTVLTGHSGAGIVIADNRDALVPAPLFVEYKKKKSEYRVHVGRIGDDIELIGVQQKKRRTDHENPDWQVRNHANGFIYARSDVNPPDSVVEAAKRTLRELDLDFGAVDVIYNHKEATAYVLEINTAPGLEGSTVTDYRDFFRKVMA